VPVFLGYEDSGIGGVPYYPTAKLGDFGVARKCDLKDPGNSNRLLEAGTKGWQAPVSSNCLTYPDVAEPH